MDITSSTGRRRNNVCVNAEDNALNQITKEVCQYVNACMRGYSYIMKI